MDLVTTNLDTEAVVIGEALHTYLHIGDIGDVQVTGLENTAYLDKVAGSTRHTQDGAVTFNGEVDRVYVDTEATCEIVDARLKRRIVVAKSGSRSTVVWTPWNEKADKMGDFGPDGWRRMVCVESANALENVVTVPAGASHCLRGIQRQAVRPWLYRFVSPPQPSPRAGRERTPPPLAGEVGRGSAFLKPGKSNPASRYNARPSSPLI
jgi:D-hexose-6-phosphate mutarotase